MAITFHPKAGLILLCDFEPGFKAPEMVKTKRPVVVLAGPIQGRSDLVTVVPLSTVAPTPVQKYHYQIPKNSMPMVGKFQQDDNWLKGDMIYTVGFHRLYLIQLGGKGSNGKRRYFTNRLGHQQMKSIRQCVLHGLNMSSLVPYVT